MEVYPIYDGNQKIGQAQICREGMFLRISCACRPASGAPRRICAKWNGGSLELGLCVPTGDQMTLLRRIPQNKLVASGLSFYTLSRSDEAVQIFPDRPIENLSMLKTARLVVRNGLHYIVFRDQSSSRPTGQWSEPRISE